MEQGGQVMRATLLVLILVAIGLIVIDAQQRHLLRAGPARRPRLLRRWRPKTPAACSACRLAQTSSTVPPLRPIRPWREGRSRRGAPRRVSTAGYACRQPACPYAGITDATLHALVADGHHGRGERIQDFRCQACGSKITSRWGTALYELKTPPTRIGEVLGALAEGLSIGAAVRVFGHREATITRWRDRAADQALRLHRHFLHDLHLPHVQLDEIRARLRGRQRVTWLWLALDPATKLIPVLALGPRSQETAQHLVHALRVVLAPSCIPIIATDGLRHYYAALTAHFGQWVTCGRHQRWQVSPALRYGQVHKRYVQRRLVRIKYQLCCGSRRAFRVGMRQLGWSGKLQTAFVERLNLTARMGVAALTRRTWATAQSVAGLQRQVEWWRAYYHFSRPHRSLRRHGRARTPAMTAGLTTHRWPVCEVLGYPCA
jgi:IS1 family transposase/transposase-like protein